MMRKLIFTGVGLAALAVAGVALTNQQTSAAEVKFTFIARGIVTGVDLANKTIELDVTKAVPGSAKETMEGENIEFKVSTAKVVKVFNGLDKPVTYKNIQIGQELGMRGTAYQDDTYVLSFARIHDRSFVVVGRLEKHDEAARTVDIEIITSSYKPTTYKAGTIVTMKYFDGNSTFYSKNTKTPVNFSDVDVNHQKVQVKGTVTGSSTWEVSTLIDGFSG